MRYQPPGPPRYAHQVAALRKIIETRGRAALLMDPGTGKTAPTLDYLSLLTLKAGERAETYGNPVFGEIRALVVSPKVAVDNWVLQAQTYVSRDIDVWAEALGGSIKQKAQTLASRGPSPYTPRKLERKKDARQIPYRGLNMDRAEMLWTQSATPNPRGVEDLGVPRLVLESMNYESFSSRAQVGSRTLADVLIDGVRRFDPHVVILDESHKIKSHSSNVHRALVRVSRITQRVLLLTGTVMPHSPLDVYGQWRVMAPTAFGDLDPRTGERRDATFQGFENRYARKGGYMGHQVVGFKNLDEMQEIMAKNAIVVRKADALDLPPMTATIVPVTLSDRERKAYMSMKKQLAVQLAPGPGGIVSVPNRLAQMMRLRQITAGYMPDGSGGVSVLGSSKIEAIRGLVQDTLAGESRIVVFTLFRHEQAELARRLRVKGTEVLEVSGDTSEKERLEIRKRFGSDDPARLVLLAQVKTMSLSVNELVTANHAIFASLSQQRDDIVQAQDRLNRIGQTKPVTIHFPLVAGTIDYTIYNAHLRREAVEQAVLDHIQGRGGDEIDKPNPLIV